MTPPFLLTKNVMFVASAIVVVLMWFLGGATSLHLPFGLTNEYLLKGLGTLAAFLGMGGSSYLPGGTLFKSADSVRAQITTQASQIAAAPTPPVKP
jgi:hypothetical protein